MGVATTHAQLVLTGLSEEPLTYDGNRCYQDLALEKASYSIVIMVLLLIRRFKTTLALELPFHTHTMGVVLL